MRLTDLEPEFHRYEERMLDPACHKAPGLEWAEPQQRLTEVLVPAASLEDAQGIWFLCPACFVKNGGPVGTHMVLVAFRDRGVPDHLGSHSKEGAPSRWAVSGTDFQNLTLSPSVDCGCWHGFVTNGDAT